MKAAIEYLKERLHDKKELLEHFDGMVSCLRAYAHPDEWTEKEKRAENEIRRLIESSEPAEVGDEERKLLVEAVEHFLPTFKAFDQKLGLIRDDTKERIIAFLRQRRTVSRELFDDWVHRIVYFLDREEQLKQILAELGIEVEEKEK